MSFWGHSRIVVRGESTRSFYSFLMVVLHLCAWLNSTIIKFDNFSDPDEVQMGRLYQRFRFGGAMWCALGEIIDLKFGDCVNLTVYSFIHITNPKEDRRRRLVSGINNYH